MKIILIQQCQKKKILKELLKGYIYLKGVVKAKYSWIWYNFREMIKAADMLQKEYKIDSNVWSVKVLMN